MTALRALCVFCGSSAGRRPEYREAAADLGRLLAEQQITVVYGGAAVGLMGIVADACLLAGGKVVGVIPQGLVDREIAHRGLTELRVVRTMHERKALMADLSDAFIALPGGLGTFEEFFEIATWNLLGIQQKPCGLVNVENYYSGLLQQADDAVAEGFLRAEHRAMIVADAQPAAVLERLRLWRPSALPKWL